MPFSKWEIIDTYRKSTNDFEKKILSFFIHTKRKASLCKVKWRTVEPLGQQQYNLVRNIFRWREFKSIQIVYSAVPPKKRVVVVFVQQMCRFNHIFDEDCYLKKPFIRQSKWPMGQNKTKRLNNSLQCCCRDLDLSPRTVLTVNNERNEWKILVRFTAVWGLWWRL